MLEFNALYLSLVTIYIIMFIVVTTMGNLIYRKSNNGAKLSYFNVFPYEIIETSNPKFIKLYKVLLYIFVALGVVPLLHVTTSFNNWGSFVSVPLINGIIFLFTSLTYLGLTMVPAKFVKQHLLLVTIYMVLNFATFVFTATISITLYTSFNTSLFHLVVGIVSILFGLLALVSIFNPKLKSWAKLDKEENEDGTVTIVRPKYFALAYSEWLTYFLNFISFILISLSLLYVG